MSEIKENSSVIGAAFWMFIVSLLLFWLPVFGPLIAGFVGGKKAGGIGKGILASLVPCILLGAFMFFMTSVLTGVPILGMIAGLGSAIFIALSIGPLMVGAIIGGILA